jgi:hypothetical protein
MSITLSGTAITMNDGSTIVSTTTYGEIGSVGVFHYAASQSNVVNGTTLSLPLIRKIDYGATTAGSNLRRSNSAGDPYNQVENGAMPATHGPTLHTAASVAASSASYPDTINTTTMAGTWRLLGGNAWGHTASGLCQWFPQLWVRIS